VTKDILGSAGHSRVGVFVFDVHRSVAELVRADRADRIRRRAGVRRRIKIRANQVPGRIGPNEATLNSDGLLLDRQGIGPTLQTGLEPCPRKIAFPPEIENLVERREEKKKKTGGEEDRGSAKTKTLAEHCLWSGIQ